MKAWRIGRLPCVLIAVYLAPPAAQAAEPTAQAVASIMVAPPRTISDITAVLDQYRPDPAKAATEKAAADAQPTSDLSGVPLARFYYQRGVAAGQIGRLTQQLEDLRHAIEIGGGTDTLMLQALAQAEFQSGNPVNAIRLNEQRIPLDSQGVGIQGRLFGNYSGLVRFNVARGNLDEATRWLETIRTLYNTSSGWHPRARAAVLPFLRLNWRSNVADAETELALAKGLYRDAESSARIGVEQLEQFIRNYQTVSAAVEEPALTQFENRRDNMIVNVAVALREQGKLIEAELEARRALANTLKSVGRYHNETAVRLNALTAIIFEQGRAPEAERLAHAAIDILETVDAKGSWTLATARQSLGSALVAQDRWADAIASYDAMLAGLAGDQAGAGKFGFGNLDWAAALVKVGRPQPAVEMTTRMLQDDQRIFGTAHYKTAEARAYLAMALAGQGNRDQALQNFRDALPTLLTAAPQSAEEAATAKAQRLRLILDSYIRLLAEIRATPLEAKAQIDAAAEAFRLADTARGQAVQRALAAASARVTVQDPALADLARREQDSGKQIAALEGVLVNALSAPADQQDAGAVAALRDQITRLRQARDALLKEIERRFPDYAELINPKPATIERARQALRPGEALFATYVSDDATFVWAVPPQGPVAFAKAALSEAQLAASVKQLRRALDPQAQTLGEIPPFDVALAGRLYDALLKPVEPGWRGAASLLVVTDKALAQLPLGVLVTAPAAQPAEPAGQALFAGYKAVPFLARQVAITQLPSVAALPTLRALPAATAGRKPFIGFGDPIFNAQQAAEPAAVQIADAGALNTRGIRLKLRSAPKTETTDSATLAMLPRLPDTADEVRSIARALNADPDKDVFVGAAANEHTVETLNLADRRVIAFATHGLVPGDLNGLTEPALALSAPALGDGGDGLLTMDEVLALKLNADWVVLSACNTASGDGAGAEAVSGLGRAFFYAGARALLVSNWPVETISARLLTTDLFHRQAENPALGRAEALRQAELALIDGADATDPATKKITFSYAHPIFWAPFSLVGDGGGMTR
jgi:CHAT domain-containing protein